MLRWKNLVTTESVQYYDFYTADGVENVKPYTDDMVDKLKNLCLFPWLFYGDKLETINKPSPNIFS